MSTTPTSPFKATVDQVGAMLHARTVNTDGQEVGTFTPETRPTDTQVDAITALVAGGLDAVAGQYVPPPPDAPLEWPDALVAAGQDACVLCACWRIEAGFFPAQTQTNQSPVLFYRDACNAAMGAWEQLVIRWGGAIGLDPFESASLPLFSFPGPYLGPPGVGWWDPTTETVIIPEGRALPAFPELPGMGGGWWAVFTEQLMAGPQGNPSAMRTSRMPDEARFRRAITVTPEDVDLGP